MTAKLAGISVGFLSTHGSHILLENEGGNYKKKKMGALGFDYNIFFISGFVTENCHCFGRDG